MSIPFEGLKKAAHPGGFAGARNCNATLRALGNPIRSLAHRIAAPGTLRSVPIHNDEECHVKPIARMSVQTLILFAAFLGAAGAADGNAASNAQKVYQRDRAACLSGTAGEDRAACLREAGAALQEAKGGRLGYGDTEFERNRLLRCEKQPVQDREACIRRMNGEGITSGSVEGGGIYRELTVPVAAPGNK
jgi:hypothetical protein